MTGAVEANICFVERSNEPLISWPSVAGGQSEKRSGAYRDHPVTIHNARDMAEPSSLDQQGFTLVGHSSDVGDYLDDECLTRVYEPELQRLLLDMTGAEKVVVFDHTRRAGDPLTRSVKKLREPVHLAHSDYTEKSGPEKLPAFLPEEEARRRLQRRFAIINVWRSIAGAVQSSPIAVCDALSVKARDLLKIERRAKDRIGEILGLAHHPDQRWYYFPQMQETEALVFKCFDSERDGRARMSPHTAFTDPETPINASQRQSIESRCLVLF